MQGNQAPGGTLGTARQSRQEHGRAWAVRGLEWAKRFLGIGPVWGPHFPWPMDGDGTLETQAPSILTQINLPPDLTLPCRSPKMLFLMTQQEPRCPGNAATVWQLRLASEPGEALRGRGWAIRVQPVP